MSEEAPSMVFSGTDSRYLTKKIYANLGCPLGKMNIAHFADGEFAVSYEESIRGANVFLAQSTFPNSDNLMELLLMVDAAKRTSTKSMITVIPYFSWVRQDRKDRPCVSVGAKLVADLFSIAGIDRLTTIDLHVGQAQSFFNIPIDHLYASAIFLPCIKSLKLDDLVITTPGVGGSKRASTFSKYLGIPLVLYNETREETNVVAAMQIIGDVQGKNVVLVDDIVDTVGIITKAANVMMGAGAESVRAITNHYVMSDPVSLRVQESGLTEVAFTDSIPYTKKCAKVKQLSIVGMFAETIRGVVTNESISSQYIVQNLQIIKD